MSAVDAPLRIFGARPSFRLPLWQPHSGPAVLVDKFDAGPVEEAFQLRVLTLRQTHAWMCG
jgi:hypothetical protein